MYVAEPDFYNLIAKDDFDAALDEGFTSMEAISRTACATVQNYLYQRYRIRSEFDNMGNDRNAHLVMIVCDIALYILFSSLPGRLSEDDIRTTRYHAAIRWLENVAAGRIGAGIPSLTDPIPGGTNPETDPEYFAGIRFESETKLQNNY